MKRTSRSLLFAGLALAPALFAACAKEESVETSDSAAMAPAPTPPAAELTISSVTLGNKLNTDSTIASPMTTFSPRDTVYASVATSGQATGATISARWSMQDGQLVDESSQSVSPTGPATVHFHLGRPDGLATGKYKVEILVNGNVATSQEFEVK